MAEVKSLQELLMVPKVEEKLQTKNKITTSHCKPAALNFQANQNQMLLEAGVHYSESTIFKRNIQLLQIHGKALFGSHFQIFPNDYDTIFKLLVYFIRDAENADRLGISLKKGLILSGPIGSGKTSLMRLLNFLLPKTEQYHVISTRKLSQEYSLKGPEIILRYSDPAYKGGVLNFCFDDLGLEHVGKYFGQDCQVMEEILLSRYDYIYKNLKTYITTNLDNDKIEKFYGRRVRSRLREMCNVISFPKDTNDKRS